MQGRDPRWWVWAEALELLEGGKRSQRRFLVAGTEQSAPCWQPGVDMYEQDAGLKVLFALPGIRADQIEVVIDAAGIVVRGWRTPTWAAAPAVIQRIEIPYGRFERRVTLPPGTFRLASQTLQDGCLTLVLQRT